MAIKIKNQTFQSQFKIKKKPLPYYRDEFELRREPLYFFVRSCLISAEM